MTHTKLLNKSKLIGIFVIAMMIFAFIATAGVSAAMPDPAIKGKITVHKYGTSAPSDQIGTGIELSKEEAKKLGQPLKGVGFTLYKIPDSFTLTENTKPSDAKAASLANVVGSKTGETGQEYFTNDEGEIVWQDLEHGYYVLSETTLPPGDNKYVASPDAIIAIPYGYTGTNVGWNYDVHVYPKNVLDDDVTKERTTADEFYTAGESVAWKISAKVQSGLRAGDASPYNYGAFKVTDVLDSRLDLDATNPPVLKVIGVNDTVKATLDLNTDYTFTQSGAENRTLVWELTQAGIDKVVDNGGLRVSIDINTKINDTAASGLGNTFIENDATYDWKNHDDSDFTPAKPPVKPVAQLGGVELLKLDDKDRTIFLNGAKFKIAATEADALDPTGSKFIKEGYDDSKGDMIVTTGDNPGTPTVEKGWGMFAGLKLNDSGDTKFYLVEVEAPTHETYKYVLRPDVIEVTIAAGSKKVSVEVLNTRIGDDGPGPIFQLPKTGGPGTIIFTVLGLCLIAAAVILLMRARRRNNTEQNR